MSEIKPDPGYAQRCWVSAAQREGWNQPGPHTTASKAEVDHMQTVIDELLRMIEEHGSQTLFVMANKYVDRELKTYGRKL